MALLAALTAAPIAMCASNDAETEEVSESKGIVQMVKNNWMILLIVLILAISLALALHFKRQRNNEK